MRQNIKLRLANRQKKAAIRTEEKKLRNLISENKMEEAETSYRRFSSLIDRASKRNIVHKNNAGRKKARLSALMKKSSTGTSAPGAPAPEAVVESAPAAEQTEQS